MAYHSVREIYDAIDAARERLRARLESLDDASADAKNSPEAWSVAEIVEHLATIERRMVSLLSGMLAKAEEKSSEEATSFAPVSLDRFAERSRAEKYDAPEAVRPRGGVPLASSLANLETSRESLRALMPRIEARDLSPFTFPHPAFGQLNFYEWLLFIGAHEGRHLKQIERSLDRMSGINKS
jgi:hypothetical protein